MSIFDDGFDAEDAATIGGAMGFAEESMRIEDEGLFEEPEPVLEDLKPFEINEVNLQIFKNTNPGLFKYIVGLVARQKRLWRKKLAIMRSEESNGELEALARTERLLEESEDDAAGGI